MGPIYRVRCNPFWHPTECPVFISFSYDWTDEFAHILYYLPPLISEPPACGTRNPISGSPSSTSCRSFAVAEAAAALLARPPLQVDAPAREILRNPVARRSSRAAARPGVVGGAVMCLAIVPPVILLLA